MRGVTAATIASTFALAAFAIAVMAGLASGNGAAAILVRAIIAMVVRYPVGLGAGFIAQRLVQEHIDANAKAHPVPDSSEEALEAEPAGARGDDEEVIVA